MMKTQLQKSKREEYELHERADSHLLNMDAFRKETEFNFREVRADIVEIRAGIVEIKADIVEMKADIVEMKADIAILKSDVAVPRRCLRNSG